VSPCVVLIAATLVLVPRWTLATCPPGDFGGCKAQCESGDPDSCATLGSIYRTGTVGVPRDEARAVELYRKSCQLGSQAGCADLRRMYKEGLGFSGKGGK
jgi:TPR repeat protein